MWKILARFYPRLLKTMDDTTLAVIRKTRTAPTLWSLSPIWPVHNGKQGLQGKRQVNGEHCFSWAFMRLSYKRQVPSSSVHGGVAGRRSSKSGAQHPNSEMFEERSQILEPSKEERLLKRMGPDARKNLAKCHSKAVGTRSPSSQASRMLAGCGGRSRHNDQAKNYCNAHQLPQIRRFVEVKACLF